MSKAKTVRVATASYPITAFADVEGWHRHAAAWVADAATQGAQVLVFPEYGSMALLSTFPAEVQGSMAGNLSALQPLVPDFCAAFAGLAQRHGVVIVAPSLPVAVAGGYLNRAYVFGPRGSTGYQDKFFMTRFEDEDWGVSPGPKVLTVFEAEWGSFGIQICYDVEFGVGSAALCQAGADLILVPSCTETIRGATRVHVGARARALENQCYVVVSQTVGEALWSLVVDLNYGFAAVYSTPDAGLPEEGILGTLPPNVPGWLVQDLDLELQAAVREDGQVFNFKDQRRITHRLLETELEIVRVAL